MLVLMGSFRIPAERVEAAVPYFVSMAGRTLAEPGCRECSYALDVAERGLVRAALVFDDVDALLAHRNADYVATEWKDFEHGFEVRDYHFDQYEVVSGQAADWRKTS